MTASFQFRDEEIRLICHNCNVQASTFCYGYRSTSNVKEFIDEFEKLHPDTKRRRHSRAKKMFYGRFAIPIVSFLGD